MAKTRSRFNPSDPSQGRLFVSEEEQDSDYIESWDEYFLEFAATAAQKSKDPRCRVGAALVRDKMVIATGYNGFARGVYDDGATLQDVEEKLKLVCHAESNAITNAARAGVRLDGATMYVTKFPCLACCNAIVQAGVTCLYTHDQRFWDDDPADSDHTRKKAVLKQGRVEVVAPFHPYYGPAAKRPDAARRRRPTRRARNAHPAPEGKRRTTATPGREAG